MAPTDRTATAASADPNHPETDLPGPSPHSSAPDEAAPIDAEQELPPWARTHTPRPRGPLHPLGAIALAAASGTAMLAAFPPYGLWWLAPVAVAGLAIATRHQRVRLGLVLGTLFGAAFLVPLLHWTGIYVGPLPWLLLAGLQTIFLTLLGGASAAASRLPLWCAPAVTAALWVGQEALRSRIPWGGFPWGRIAFSQDSSPLLHLASLGGAPLVTFAVALAGGALALAAAAPRYLPPRVLAVRTAVVLAAAGAGIAACGLVPLPDATGPTATVAVVQGNVPRLGLDFNAQKRAVLDNHADATLALAARIAAGELPRPDLVVWPENSSDIDPLENPDAREVIDRAADAIDAPILVGAVLEGPGRFVSNAGIVWSPGSGPGERYVKRHPVPFAEYMPMRSIARRITEKVDLVRRDFTSGDEVGALRLGGVTVGDVICFEVAYDDLVRDTVTEGAQLVVVQTNNATFGRTAESAQQLAMVRLRAIEHGRPAVMASTSGVSATMDASGRILDQSGIFVTATFVRDLRLSGHRTVATMLGGWPEAAFALAGLAALVAAMVLRHRPSLAPIAPRTANQPTTSSVDAHEEDE